MKNAHSQCRFNDGEGLSCWREVKTLFGERTDIKTPENNIH